MCRLKTFLLELLCIDQHQYITLNGLRQYARIEENAVDTATADLHLMLLELLELIALWVTSRQNE